MLRQMKTKIDIEAQLIHTVTVREARHEAGKDLKPSDYAIRTLMWCLGIPNGWRVDEPVGVASEASWFDDVLKGGIECDRCQRLFLACLAQVGLEGAVLCEECKIEEDPLVALHETLKHNWREAEYAEVMDHCTDNDGVTESFPAMVRLDK